MDKLEFIREHCRTVHSGRLLSDHLINVYNLLKEEGHPEEVCDAGLFHSIYGTESYMFTSNSVEDRNLICSIIGNEAERLVHLFCTLPVPREESFAKVEDKTISAQLLSIHEANDKEQEKHAMIYDHLFPSVVGRNTLNEDNSGIFDFCQKKRKEFEGRVRSNQDGGWQSNDLMWDEVKDFPAMASLLHTIEGKLNQYKFDMGWRLDSYCYIENWWININSRNSTNVLHLHPQSFFSGAYYVHANPEVHGPIVFRTPIAARLGMLDDRIEPNTELQEYNRSTSESWQYAPETGNLLIFPAWLEHFVKPNETDEERISISFNAITKITEESP